MTARALTMWKTLAALAFLSAAVACGDTTSELITDPAGGGVAGGGGTSSGGAPGGAAGSSSGSQSGGASGASMGGASAGSAGTPECTPETAATDCTDSERSRCHPTKHVCVECTDEGQCDANEDCSDDLGECAIPCTSSDACVDDDDSICDTLIRFCVQCVANEDCPSNQCANWECVN